MTDSQNWKHIAVYNTGIIDNSKRFLALFEHELSTDAVQWLSDEVYARTREKLDAEAQL